VLVNVSVRLNGMSKPDPAGTMNPGVSGLGLP
jgi:hypothetical protein